MAAGDITLTQYFVLLGYNTLSILNVLERFEFSFICRILVDGTLLACYIGIGSVYVVFIAGIIQECIDSEKIISQSYYALIIFPLFFVMNMARNLADIAPISVAGNILLFAASLIGIVYALKDGIGDTWSSIGPNVSLYPKFIGTVFFSMCSPGVVSF